MYIYITISLFSEENITLQATILSESNPQVLPVKLLKIWILRCVVKTTMSKACHVPRWSCVIQCNLSRCNVKDLFGSLEDFMFEGEKGHRKMPIQDGCYQKRIQIQPKFMKYKEIWWVSIPIHATDTHCQSLTFNVFLLTLWVAENIAAVVL